MCPEKFLGRRHQLGADAEVNEFSSNFLCGPVSVRVSQALKFKFFFKERPRKRGALGKEFGGRVIKNNEAD